LRRHAILVDTDNGLDTSVNLPLEGQRRVAANLLRNAGFDRSIHAAGRIDAGNHRAST
jgi:hypothetical protein